MNFSKCFCRLLVLALAGVLLLSGCKKEVQTGKIRNIDDLNDPKFTIGGEIETIALRTARKKLPKAKTAEYDSGTDLPVALLSRKIDAIAYDRPVLEYIATRCPDLMILPQNLGVGYLAIGIAPGKKDLLEPINRFIRMTRANGTYNEMFRRWLKTNDPKLPEFNKLEKPNGKLIVGIETGYAPFVYLDPNGKPTGYDVEYALRLALFLNMECVFKDMEYSALFPAVASGRVDIAVSQIDVTPERAENMIFSEPYIDSSLGIMIRKCDYDGTTASPMERLHAPDMKIGVLLGTNATNYCEKNFPQDQLCYFPTGNDAYAAVQYKRIDAFFFDRKNMAFVVRQNPVLKLLPEDVEKGSVVVGFPKTHTELCKRVNEFIRQIRKDGTYDDMYKRWCLADKLSAMPDIPAPKNPTMKLKAGIYGTNLPLSFYNEDRKMVGYDPEFVKRLALFLNAEIEIIDIPYPAILAALESGKIDMLVSGMNSTPERRQKFLVSDEYIDSTVAVMVHEDFLNGPQVSKDVFSGKMKKMTAGIKKSFLRNFVVEKRWKLILDGLKITILITVFSVLLGTLLAFPLCMLRRSQNCFLQKIGKGYIMLMQGTPILVILMILYYIVFADSSLSAECVAIIGFSLNFSAYAGEMLRTGIDGIPKGQTEAAITLSLTKFEIYWKIILPQATRSILPVFRGACIDLMKTTSIVGYIAIQDLTRMSDIIRSRTYEAFFPLISTAVIYFIAAWLLALGLRWFERRLDPPKMRRERSLEK